MPSLHMNLGWFGGGARRYAGVWQCSFETSAFTTTAGEGPYWLVAEGDVQRALTAPLNGGTAGTPSSGPWGRVAIVVEGRLSHRGHYGHLGAYARQLQVDRVIEARLLQAEAPPPAHGS